MRAPHLNNMFALLMGSGAQVFSVCYILMSGLNLHCSVFVELRPVLHYVGVALLAMSGLINGYVLVTVMRLF
jgi:hypothetical protein